MISSKELVDSLIVGSITSFSPQTMRLLDLIENNQQVPLNDVALNDPEQLSVAIFNYPIIKDGLYKEFSEAAKRISSAKYAYYKKSATFKDNFTKLCTETFNKHHQTDDLSHLEQIQKVRSAMKVIKFIGELYVADFFINCNIAHFLEVLSKNIVESKVSQDCLECLISIISNRVKNEVKLYKHNVHTAAIVNIITEYENETSKIKRNYKDLEIIEAVNKTIKNKSLKGSNNRSTKDASRSETVRQTKKIFETILSGNMNLSFCAKAAHDVSILFPGSFENEMLQLCFDYIKKTFEAPDENLKAKCVEIMRFIGMLYNYEALTNDGVKGTINFLNKFDSIFSEPLVNVIFNEIYDKVMEIEDELLKPVIPENFEKILNGSASETELDVNDIENEQEEEEIPSTRRTSSPELIPLKRHSICENVTVTVCDPIEKFKELLIKLSPTNIAYILRETSTIKFSNGEDTVKELATHLIDHAVNKSTLIKAITQVAVKLPETIVPHFNTSLMKKHLRALISTRIIGCSERESIAYGQLIKELHSANYYDRFDIIILLDNFTENFNHDRTALTSLLQFIEEFNDILIGKKLSKNMKQRLTNISSKLSIKMAEESDEEFKESISNAIKILNSETRPQSESSSCSKKEINNNYKTNGDVTYYRSESYSQSENSSPSPIQLPPMHIPPPKMFIPPPNLIFVAPQNALEIMESKNNWPSLVNKEKHQLSYTTVVDTKSDDDLSNRQSGSPSSVSISLQEIEMESDEFYDTASNAENSAYEMKNDNESAYSSLVEPHYNKEDVFKNIIRCQFSYNTEAIESFATLFIKRGMKSKNSGYMNLIEEIQEGLKDNEELFGKFILILEKKFLEFIQNLPKSDVEVMNSDKRKHLQLILLIGEFYNLGFMKNQTFIACLEKLLNDIGTDHQITLFHQLIKISFDKIIQNGITNVIKTFMDMMAKKLPTIVDAKDRNLAAWELFVTMKILAYRQQKAHMQCPVTYFKLFLSNLNEETIMMKLEELKFRYCYKKEQIAEIVEFFLLTAISSFQSAIYVKLADELHAIKSATDKTFTFQKHMEFKLHDVIKNILNDIQNEASMIELFKMTSFVGDLFVGNAASIYLVLCILEMMMEKEIESKKIVDCIKILLQKVGYKIDLDSVLILDKFFMFFKQVIKCDKGYRRIVYKELIDLRANKWQRMENERNLEVIDELFGKLTHANFIQISFFICGILSKNYELIELFVKLIWKFILMNPESVLLYAKLSSAISNYNERFRINLMTFMKQRNETFKIICCEPIVPDDAKLKLSCVMMFMSYLYAFDFCEDADIGLWIHPSFTKQLTMGQCNEISHILGTKINESKNNDLLRAFVTLMEFHSRENLFAVIKNVKNELSDLVNLTY